MFSHELLEDLREEGLTASIGRLRGARKNDVFRPRVKANTLGFFEYTARHKDQFRDYLWGVRTGARAAHMGPGFREREAMKREKKAEQMRQKAAAIAQLEAIEKREAIQPKK